MAKRWQNNGVYWCDASSHYVQGLLGVPERWALEVRKVEYFCTGYVRMMRMGGPGFFSFDRSTESGRVSI